MALVDEPNMRFVGINTANCKHCLEKIGAKVEGDSMLTMWDMVGVSEGAYGLIFKTIKGRLKLVDPALTADLMPKPHKVERSHETLSLC